MEWHPRIRVGGGDPRHQFRIIGFSRNNRSIAGFAGAQRLFTKQEGDAVLLAYSSVARHAVLIQDRANVAAEVYFVIGMMAKAGRAKQTRKEQPEDPHAGRF